MYLRFKKNFDYTYTTIFHQLYTTSIILFLNLLSASEIFMCPLNSTCINVATYLQKYLFNTQNIFLFNFVNIGNFFTGCVMTEFPFLKLKYGEFVHIPTGCIKFVCTGNNTFQLSTM